MERYGTIRAMVLGRRFQRRLRRAVLLVALLNLAYFGGVEFRPFATGDRLRCRCSPTAIDFLEDALDQHPASF